jgi:signal peptidase II
MRKYQILIAGVVVVLDRLTKWQVGRNIPLEGEVPIIPGLFRLTHLENTGAAFSMFADASSTLVTRLLILFSIAALVVISVLLWRSGAVINQVTVALALVFGGALGNLWDRALYGRVTDFLDFYIGSRHWPPFNVADSAIVIGVLLLAGRAILAPSEPKVTT